MAPKICSLPSVGSASHCSSGVPALWMSWEEGRRRVSAPTPADGRHRPHAHLSSWRVRRISRRARSRLVGEPRERQLERHVEVIRLDAVADERGHRHAAVLDLRVPQESDGRLLARAPEVHARETWERRGDHGVSSVRHRAWLDGAEDVHSVVAGAPSGS